jgi:hypothetical protein
MKKEKSRRSWNKDLDHEVGEELKKKEWKSMSSGPREKIIRTSTDIKAWLWKEGDEHEETRRSLTSKQEGGEGYKKEIDHEVREDLKEQGWKSRPIELQYLEKAELTRMEDLDHCATDWLKEHGWRRLTIWAFYVLKEHAGKSFTINEHKKGCIGTRMKELDHKEEKERIGWKT